MHASTSEVRRQGTVSRRAALLMATALLVVVGAAQAQQPAGLAGRTGDAAPADVFGDPGGLALPREWPGHFRDPELVLPTPDDPVLLWLLGDDDALERRFAEPDLRPRPGGAWRCVRCPEPMASEAIDGPRLLAARGALPIATFTAGDPAAWLASVLEGSVVEPVVPGDGTEVRRWGVGEWVRFHDGVVGLVAVGRHAEALAALEHAWPAGRGLFSPATFMARETSLENLWALVLAATPRATRAVLEGWVDERSQHLVGGLHGADDVAELGEVLALCHLLGRAAPLARLVRRMPDGLCGDVEAAATQPGRADLLGTVADGAFDLLTSEAFDAEALAVVGALVPYVDRRVMLLDGRIHDADKPRDVPPAVRDWLSGVAERIRPGVPIEAVLEQQADAALAAIPWFRAEQMRVACVGLRVLLRARRLGQARALAQALEPRLGERVPLLVLQACRDLDLRGPFTDEWAAWLPDIAAVPDDADALGEVLAWLDAGR